MAVAHLRTDSPSSKSHSEMGHEVFKLDAPDVKTTSGHDSTAAMRRSAHEWSLTCSTVGGAERAGSVYDVTAHGHGADGCTACSTERQSARPASSEAH